MAVSLKNVSTLWRFLVPVAALLLLVPLLLSQQQSSYKLQDIEDEANEQAQTLTRLLNATETLVGERVTAAMKLLRTRGAGLGEPGVGQLTTVAGRAVPELLLGNTVQNNRFSLVDSVADQLGGTATLFVKNGDQFVRISTNIRRANGERAVGTVLDPDGKAIEAIRRGKAFRGVVDILGEPYITGYEPMRNSQGEIIGIWYVGYKVDMQVVREAVAGTRYLQTGFAAVLDPHGRPRFLSRHVQHDEAVRLLDKRPDTWKFVSADIPSWGYQVVMAYPLSEAHAAGSANTRLIIVVSSILGIVLLLVLLWQLRRLVLNPLGGDPTNAISLVQRISSGDLKDDGMQARQGTLMYNILGMRQRLREMVATLQQNADRLSLAASVFDHAHDGIFIADANGRIVEINPAFCTITGYSRDEALGQTTQALGFATEHQDLLQQLLQSGERAQWRGETRNRRKDGQDYAAWLDIFTVSDEAQQVAHYVGLFSDITQIRQQQDSLEHMAYHDPLTQLPNRALFSDRLQQALARAARSETVLAVCYIDLDGFKPVNDTLGHDAGDQLLVSLSRRLTSSLRAGDTVARMGGDEFALLLCDLSSKEECRLTVARLLELMAAPYFIGGKAVCVSASIGITTSPFQDDTPDTLLRQSDQAMYQAKLAGKNRFHFFDAEQDQEVRTRHEVLARIQQALDKSEFSLHYQPKVDMRSGRVFGVEALIRWQCPERGLVLPGEFLPQVEHSDFVIRLGEWVILQALRQTAQWQKEGLSLPVSVNIAPHHLMFSGFAARLADLLRQQPDAAPSMLELEITESAALEDIASVISVIRECQQLGVRFALDDFGAGYSSLTYLRRLPTDSIKIDQSFVRDMLQDPDDLTIVASVISLSRDFNRQVIAEGVESAEHGARLLNMDCHLGQGYGIAAPMPASAIPHWVETYRIPLSWAAAMTPIHI